MKELIKKILTKINFDSQKVKIILGIATLLAMLFFVGHYFYINNHISDYSRITILVNNREYLQAEQELQTFLSDNASDPYFLILVARTYIGRGAEESDLAIKKNYFSKSIQVLNSAEALNRNIAELYSIKALTYVYLGEPNFAMTYYKKALSIEPQSESIMSDFASFLLSRGDLDGSLAKYSEILNLNKSNFDARAGIIRIFLSQGKYEKARPIAVGLSQYATTPYQESIAYSLLAKTYFKLNRYTDAFREYERALVLNPQYVDAQYGIAEVMFARDFDITDPSSSLVDAIAAAKKAVTLDPSYPFSYVLLASIYSLTKNETDYTYFKTLALTKITQSQLLNQADKQNLINSIPKFGGKNGAIIKIKALKAFVSTSTPQRGVLPK